ncbi:MAG: 2-succinyl-6-hydroxy-2,4-cyclohexadiene-1-carboxylate synthase [Chloroflexi bacterium]|nr:2-succinyl-6-hydroxy-2,4-cyclohexadiene-1-carboxylate synthase [Chloroflexota bacterium]
MLISATPSGQRYNVEARGKGEALALLHGFSGAASTWDSIAEELADDFQLVLIDLLGHGASDAPRDTARYRMESVAADIVDLLDKLGVAKPHLLGYSMGGRLALFLALRYPTRIPSLILESASPGLAGERAQARRRQHDNILAEKIEARGISWFVDYWERRPLWASQSDEQIGRQRSQRLANNPLGLANCLRAMGAGAQPNLWGALPSLALPTCLIVGERDAKFRQINQAMRATIPNSRLTIIPAAGHNTHLEQPAAFCRALRSFMDCV